MSLRNVRLLQLLGVVIAVVGLAGFWLTRDVQRTVLNLEQRQLFGIEDKVGAEPISFVVAGRDMDYTQAASDCVWRDGVCYREHTGEFTYGHRTDTIIYASLIGDTLYMINIPRDIYLPGWQTKINSMYYYRGAEGLMREVEKILGVPVDYYAIIKMDIFKELVDDIGGVDIVIPYDMYYRDSAAGLVIDFDKGPTHLNGDEAAKFVRYRHTLRGDLDRIDNVKRLAYAMLARLKELNVAAVGKVPALIDTFFDEVETNATPALVREVVPRIGDLEIVAATLPNKEIPEGLTYEPEVVEDFLAATFGGTARPLVTAPEEPILITNRSGIPGLELLVKERLVALGVSEELLLTREASEDPSPTHIVATDEAWRFADYYSSLLHVGKQQIDRFMAVGERRVHLELILGGDAESMALANALAQGGN